jgi:large subunit ribosomal protein L4
MPTTTLFRKDGSEAGTIELPDELFAAPVNEAVIHQAVRAQMAGSRLGTHKTKRRGEVSGTGKKPFRQKGTGRARQGSRRSPQFAGGGIVFGPQPRSYAQRLPRQMKRLALRGALSGKFADGAVKVVEDLTIEEVRTRTLLGHLDALGASGHVLVVSPERDERLELSARNVPDLDVILADSLNVVAVLRADTLLFTQAAVEAMRALPAAGEGEGVPA